MVATPGSGNLAYANDAAALWWKKLKTWKILKKSRPRLHFHKKKNKFPSIGRYGSHFVIYLIPIGIKHKDMQSRMQSFNWLNKYLTKNYSTNCPMPEYAPGFPTDSLVGFFKALQLNVIATLVILGSGEVLSFR